MQINIVITGVGGQGTLLASRILGALAADNGLDVKVSEVHGMAQRGGNVVTYVRIGDKVHSPLSKTARRMSCWHLSSWRRCARCHT